MTLRQRLGSLWVSIRYNPIAEWHFERKLRREGWRCATGHLTLEPENYGVLALLGVGNVVDSEGKPLKSDRADLVRWATCAVAGSEVLDEALRVAERLAEFGLPDDVEDRDWLFHPGYEPERAVSILSEARERLTFLDA